MPHKGFISSAATFIRQIRQNLSEGRYSIGDTGFPIIKELVQNADDAGAEVLHIGICEPLAGASHPLLQSPGMYVINDGEFDQTDSANIRRFGENTKSMDAAKIGKFGLGLKSIFHLCEAFFFFGEVSDGTGTKFVADILNPWSDQADSFHPEWDEFSEQDRKLVLKALLNHFDAQKCFCIWIPLRQRVQVEGSEPIIKFFPGDDLPQWLSTDELSPEIGRLIPMLENLHSIRGWRGIGEGAKLEFHISLADDSRRRKSFDALEPATPTPFQGSVLVGQESGHPLKIVFAGTEVNPFDGTLDRLEDDEHWPSDLGRDPETGNPRNIREKARQHAAVCTSVRRCKAHAGSLSISWAVFLPLGAPEIIPVPGSGVDISLVLHGYFFVDAGRNRPIGLHDVRDVGDELRDDEQLRYKWNQRLADIGTLPLLPTCLNALVEHKMSQLGTDKILLVTRAIMNSAFFAEFRSQICSVNGWGLLWNADGSRSWRLFDASSRVCHMPPSKDHSIPLMVFPALPHIVSKTNVTAVGSPSLLHEGLETSWQEAEVELLLASVAPVTLIRSASQVDYLCDFLDLLSENGDVDCHWGEVVRILRQGIHDYGLREICNNGVDVERLLSIIPSERRLTLDLPEDFADALIREMNQFDVGLVFVPRDLDPSTGPRHVRLQTSDAVEILTSLAERQLRRCDSAEQEAVAVLAAQLLYKVANHDEVIVAVADLALFTAKDCLERQDVLVSWNRLQEHRKRKTLFTTPSPSGYSLQNALTGESVLLVSKECFVAILPGELPSQCTQARIVETISRHDTPRLAGPADRVAVLKTLLAFRSESGQADAHHKVVRYLLHGEQKAIESSSSLLITFNDGSDVWRRITHISLKRQDAEWRLLAPIFASLLSGDHLATYSINYIGAETAIPLICEAGPAAFSALNPSSSEYTSLLKEINNAALCKQLPIHQNQKREFVSIEDHCYWESDVTLPQGLAGSITILIRSDDESTWRRQLELAHPLDATAVIEIVLAQSSIAEHWKLIMDSLPEAGELSDECRKQLRSRPWLPNRTAEPIAADDIIDLPLIADDVAKLTSAFPGIFFEPGMLRDELLEHPEFANLQRRFFPNSEMALSMLGELLYEDRQNHLGPLPAEVFNDWKNIALGMPKELFSCGELLAHVVGLYPTAAALVFEQLTNTKEPITEDRIEEFLDHLRQRHIQERNARRCKSLVAVFNEYLRILVNERGFENALKGQLLPSDEGGWKRAENLCCHNDGIANSHLIDSSTESILAPYLPSLLTSTNIPSHSIGNDDGREPEWAEIQPDLNGAGERLGAYFEPWRDIVPNEQIGGFLALLGDDSNIVDLAEQYLGKNRTLEETRLKFGVPDWKDRDDQLIEDALTMMSKQRVVVEITSDANVNVLNLFGVHILVPRNTTPSNIFVGYGKRHYPFPHAIINGQRVLCFRLNEIDPRYQTEADLSKLLKDSAVKFIANAYNSYEHQTSFGRAWDELSESDQLDITIAQERIIEHGFLILDQLGMRSDPQVSAILDRWDAADRLLAEQRSGAEGRPGHSRRDPDKELREAKNALREVLENDETVQLRILDAIKQRVAEYYQYTKAAVPFEIFQNADDAAIELVQNWSLSKEEFADAATFHVVEEDTSLTLAHFGRRINQYPLEQRDVTMGFDNDLWKMLVLSLSNKGHADGENSRAVTGKFGLGFKSSYLISDRPQILSGRLAFEVTGAMYPRRLMGSERHPLDTYRSDLLAGNLQSTIVLLRLEQTKASEVLADFLKFAHIAVVFARQIKRCIVNAGQSETDWSPKEVTAVKDCLTGFLSPLSSTDESRQTPLRALMLDSEHGSLLLSIGSREVVHFDSHVPTIWVTAPTREIMELGFLLNGQFALDVGRAQLAREFSQNSELAANLGVALGNQLCHLFEASTDDEGWSRLWHTHPQVVASMQTLRKDSNDRHERMLECPPWDLILVDEAHHLNADEQSGPTLGYRFLEKIVEANQVKSMVFFSGTPHRGKNFGFLSLLKLLRPDLFDPKKPLHEQLPHLRQAMIRNNKQNVTDLKGKRLFFPPKVTSDTYQYSKAEDRFYDMLTEFIATGKTYASTLNSNDQRTAILVLIAMQKLASSSVAAIRRALKNRRNRIQTTREELSKLQEQRDLLPLYEELESNNDLDELNRVEEQLTEKTAKLSLMEDEEPRLAELIEAADAVTSETKIEKILSLLEERFSGRAVLFFTEYKATQSLLMSALIRKYGDGCVTFINGDRRAEGVVHSNGKAKTISESRETAAFRFNSGKVQFLVSTEAAGEGIDLQDNSHTLIHVDLPWNPMRLHQRVGRLNRYGQKKQVEVMTLRNPSTVESKIWDKLNEKIDSIMQSMGNVMDEPEDLLELVLGMSSPSMFREVFSDASDVPAGSLSSWFDEKTAKFGGEDVIDTVRDLIGHCAHFDFQAMSEKIPKFDLPALRPFFLSMIKMNNRNYEESESGLSFKTPDKWLTKPAIRTNYKHTIFDRSADKSIPSEKILGVGHAIIDQAIFQARESTASVTAITKQALPTPLLVYRVIDKVTSSSSNVRAFVAAVEFTTEDCVIHRDWELLIRLNDLLEKRTLRRDDAMVRPKNSVELERMVERGQSEIERRMSDFELPFQVPEVRFLGVLWPDEGELTKVEE